MHQINLSNNKTSQSHAEVVNEPCNNCGAVALLDTNSKCNSCNENEEWRYDDLAKKYGWLDCERVHAMHSPTSDYGAENVVRLQNGRELHSPAYPDACSYVRVVQDGYELGYWTADEWQQDPEVVMGAILGSCSLSNRS